ncbi:MAG: hypothetical protein AAF927_33265 [Bacteroidota bacterium]
MFLVKSIKGDTFHYLSAPEELLPRIKRRQTMLGGHTLPSVVASLFICLGLIPNLSESYALKLEQNDLIIPITIGICLIPVLILNGFIIEAYLEKYKKHYKTLKDFSQKNNFPERMKGDLDEVLEWLLDD